MTAVDTDARGVRGASVKKRRSLPARTDQTGPRPPISDRKKSARGLLAQITAAAAAALWLV